MLRIITISAAACFLSTAAAAQLGGEQLKLVNTGPRQVCVADVNADGRNDLVVACHDSDSVAILLSSGPGSFGNSTYLSVKKGPVAVAAADVDQDGKIDLAVVSDGGNSSSGGFIEVYGGNGAGSFVKIKNIPLKKTAGTPSCLGIGDLDGDGRADLLVASSTKSYATYFLQKPHGSGDDSEDESDDDDLPFSSGKKLELGGSQSWLVLADLNGDGRPDVAVPRADAARVSVRINSASGFLSPVHYNLSALSVRGLAAADVDGDGDVDLFTSSPDGAGFLLAGDGAGQFASSPLGAFGPCVAAVALGDCNLDAHVDLLSANGGGADPKQHIALVLQFGNGSLSAPMAFSTTGSPTHVAVADLDGLEALDVVAVSPDTNIVSIFLASPSLNIPPGPLVFSGSQVSAGGEKPRTLVAGDFNGDLYADVVTANENSNTLSLIEGKADGGIGATTTIATGLAPRIVIAGDLNGDASLDLVVARGTTGAEIYINDGLGHFALSQVLNTSARLAWIALTEMNNDGRLDVVGAEAGRFDVWMNDGTGAFGDPTFVTLPFAGPCNFAFGDLNLDGAFDAAATFSQSNACALLFGNDLGGFGKLPTTTFAVPGTPAAVVFGHFDNDPFDDLAISSYANGTVTVRSGDGAGGFLGAPQAIAGLGTAASLLRFDWNNDGFDDLATVDPANGRLWILMKDPSSPAFLAPVSYHAETAPMTDDLGQGALAHGALNGDVAQDLAVLNGAPGANRVSYYLNRGDGTFGIADAPIGDVPSVLAVADFDRDTVLDFLAGGSSGLLHILKGGTSPFATMTQVQLPSPLASAEVGDFDLDGVLDVAATSTNGNIYILRGQLAGGQFQFILGSTIALPGVRSIAVADLNGDEKPDLIVCSTAPVVSVLLGDGNAQFGLPISHVLSSPGDFIRVADLNHDGKRDILVSHEAGQNIQVLSGDGMGGILGDGFLPMPSPTRFEVRDINTDGNIDVIALSPALHRIYTILMDDEAAPTSFMVIPLPETPSSLAIADFDADTNIDVIVTHADSGNATLLYGDGKGAYRALTRFAAGPHPMAVRAGTFDASDTRTDILVANSGPSSVSLFNGFGTSFYKFSGNSSNCATGTPKAAAVGDLNKDGNKDTASVQKGSNSVNITINNTPQGTVCKGPYPVGTQPSALVIADVNADSNLDVVVTNYGSNDVSILIGDGTGNVAPAVNYPAGMSPTAVRVVDTNADGNVDLTITNGTTPGGVTILLGHGDGTFGDLFPTPNVGAEPNAVETADVNLNGSMDLVLASSGDNSVIGGETFTVGFGFTSNPVVFNQTFQIPVGKRPVGLAIGNFNHDAYLDIVTANEFSNSVSVLMGADHQFGYSSPAHFPTGTSPRGVVARDFNYDGIPDFVTGNGGSKDATILFGDGAGGVMTQFSIPIGNGGDPEGIAVGDLENDARWDFVLPRNDGAGGTITSIINLTPTPAGLSFYGEGTPGCFGPEILRGNSVPKIGNFLFAFNCTNAPPNSVGLGIATDTPDFDGGILPGFEVEVWIDLFNATEVSTIRFDVDGDGFARGDAPIRNIPDLVGKHLYIQAFFFWGSICSPSISGLSSSNAVEVVIQP